MNTLYQYLKHYTLYVQRYNQMKLYTITITMIHKNNHINIY